MEFMRKFKPAENTIKEFENWIVVIREKQVTLGACVILLKRQVSSLSEMTESEASEFPKVINWYERKCQNCYGAEKFNYVVAMMKDNFVHYHAFPRYSFVIHKYEKEWKDQDWPKVVNFRDVDIEKEILNKIIEDMKA